MSLEDATLLSESSGLLLVIDFTAEWCLPCKKMDASTWVSSRVDTWIKQNAVAVQIDIDADRELVRSLRISALPAVVAMKGGKEVARLGGYAGPDDMLVWLESARAGDDQVDALRQLTNDRSGLTRQQFFRVRQLARLLTERGDDVAAIAEYEWVWRSLIANPGRSSLAHLTVLSNDMAILASYSDEAVAVFARLRNDAGTRLRSETRSWIDLTSWVLLNNVIKDTQATLDWVDRVHKEPGGEKSIAYVLGCIEDILILNGRWQAYGDAIKDPRSALRDRAVGAVLAQHLSYDVPADRRDIVIADLRTDAIRKGAAIHVALLAAGREEEAWHIAADLRNLFKDESIGAVVVPLAIEAKVAAVRHFDLLRSDDLDDAACIEPLRAYLVAGK